MRIVSVKQMSDLEKEANQKGLTFEIMMRAAGKGLAELVHQKYFKNPNQNILGLVGSGNNGGDTLVALINLVNQGWHAKAYLVKERKTDDVLVKEYVDAGGQIAELKNDNSFSQLKKWVKVSDVILDGIFGTGIHLPLQGDIPKILGTVKSSISKSILVAVDCPSGVDCESGDAAEECLKADLTVCMAAVKAGLLKMPANKYTGKIKVVDIGLQKSLKGWKPVHGEMINKKDTISLLPARTMDSHKGTYGSCMVIAGSVNYCGAALLASKSAYRVGAGLVRTAIPGAIYDTLAGQLPETTWLVLPDLDGMIKRDAANIIHENLERLSALLIGPGFGLADGTQQFMEDLLRNSTRTSSKNQVMGFTVTRQDGSGGNHHTLPPMVVDADGLKLLKKIKDWWKLLPEKSILTPHPGEMSVLTELSIEEIQQARIEIAVEYAEKWKLVVVLKGALTVIAEPNGRYAIVPIASSALATAGTGDVLAGMIAGYLAQGLAAFSAAKAGAWIHAKAGQYAAKKLGNEASVMAGDVIDAIPDVLKSTTGIR